LIATRRPQVWAGVECAHLAIPTKAGDQLTATGHARRPADIDRLAELGVTAVRYPVLWGWRGHDDTDWNWATDRLGRLRRTGVRAVVGLLHHGHGPPGSSMLDADFPQAFARYARSVARRFPEVDAYLPINEPLTTARFGGLYGLWPPHAADDAVFVRLLLAQCLALRAAFREIRRVRRDAELIVNEDLGRTYGTAETQSQVVFDNHRRWLTWDLLSGRVGPDHPLWSYLAAVPGARAGLDVLRDDPVPPTILGIDYYVTSDRFLDHRVHLYPPHLRGGNGLMDFADVELARVHGFEIDGFGRAIDETWARYHVPVALTEVHLGGRRTDQAAWWLEAWSSAERSVAAGVPVRSVTAWAAFGAWDWASLLCRDDGLYETGAFDARTVPPALTPLGSLIARTADAAAMTRRSVGWWRAPERALYRAPRTSTASGRVTERRGAARPWPGRPPARATAP
jgi:dTDP-4-dehydrorhamnose reductase